MPRTVGPVWIVQPDFESPMPPEGAHPEHPIVIPPDTDPDNPHPAHPIVLPDDPRPTHPIFFPDFHPDHTLPGDLPRPDHTLPGDQPRPDHTLPGDLPGGGTEPGPDDPRPTHPIVLPRPDNELPPGLEEVGECTFYQRKTLGINWDENFDPALMVGIYTVDGDQTSLVRTVANDGSSSVTYPQDFTGEVTIRVAGINGYLEGTTTVK